MKKIFIRLVASALLCLLTLCPLSGCGKAEDSGDIDITCTVFPIYDWVRSIVGDTKGVNVRLLVKNGTDVHSFQPSFEDMATVKGSEAVVYIGGASDGWIGDSASEGAEKLSISELEGIRLYSASDTTDSHTHHEGEEHSHTETFDEHLWLSISNAKVTCQEIYGLLCRLDGDNKEAYESNLSAYMSKLDSLESAMAAIGEKADKPLVFADRFPFVYLLHDYHIPYRAAFSGCSTEVNSGFETQIDLIKLVRLMDSPCIFTIEGGDKHLAEAIANETGCRVYSLNSMQSVKRSDIESGATYLEIMENNVKTLKEAYLWH